jgi:hypothetical protein
MAGSTPLVLVQFDEAVAGPDGQSYVVRACGRVMDDGTGRWEGWLEFTPADGGEASRTGQETTQPNVTDLRYWATGLTRAYLEGALRRALEPPPRDLRTDRRIEATPAYEGPAPHRSVARTAGGGRMSPIAVLNPFAVYAQGESVLRKELSALDAGHLRNIVRAYGLAGAREDELDTAAEPVLVETIVAGVRRETRPGTDEESLETRS